MNGMRANINSWRKRNRRLKEPLRARALKFIKGWFRTMAVLTSVPVIAFASWNAYRELKASPFFAVREITVEGAKSLAQARRACFAIANSNLVKTAAYGSNPNWGRVAAAVGSLGLRVTERQLKITFSSFAKKHIQIFVDLNLGSKKTTVYTSDLSLDYVRINGRYN